MRRNYVEFHVLLGGVGIVPGAFLKASKSVVHAFGGGQNLLLGLKLVPQTGNDGRQFFMPLQNGEASNDPLRHYSPGEIFGNSRRA
jgi:hypothetical protein